MSNNSTDTIFIGKKPLMTYVTSTIIQLATQPYVTIKARGLTTSLAIDVAQTTTINNANVGIHAIHWLQLQRSESISPRIHTPVQHSAKTVAMLAARFITLV